MSATRIQAFVGPMFSSKTGALHDQLDRQIYTGRVVVLFHPTADTRDRNNGVLSAHDGGRSFSPQKLPGRTHVEWVDNSADLLRRAHELNAGAVGIDEGQFFDEELAEVMAQLHREGVKVFYAGLDTDWQGNHFPTTAKVMLCPEVNVHKLTAVCTNCGSETATRSLKVDAASSDPTKIVDPGGKEKYQAACQACFSEAMEKVKRVPS